MIPYGRHRIDDDDVANVVQVLKSPWLTTGPQVRDFESALCLITQSRFAVAVCNGTAALHTAMSAINLGADDEVIVPPITFCATVNSVLYRGAVPVFCDVDADTLLISPECAERLITHKTKAIVAVDYAGQSCDYDKLRAIADRYNLVLIADACHSLGGAYKDRPVGSLADLTVFSFHPVKNITTGEGGAIITNNKSYWQNMKRFRNHGINTDHHERNQQGAWHYEMTELGFNYRITDIQCALGISQLNKLKIWIDRRQAIAAMYDSAFSVMRGIVPLKKRAEVDHAYHLYVVKIDDNVFPMNRDELFDSLRNRGIGTQVHYIPVYLHPYYRQHLGTSEGMCPEAEKAYQSILSLPMFSALHGEEVQEVIAAIQQLGQKDA